MALARTARPAQEVYIATTTGVVKVKGSLYRYIAGKTKIDPNHPDGRAILKAVPGSFAPMRLDLGTGPVIES